MAMEFPHITHVSEVLPAIEGRTEFSYWQTNPHFDLVAYYLLASDTFKADDPKISKLRRECRGLLFHKDGTVARRAFHKFFNVGETDETMPNTLDLSEPHIVLEKLDGSMIAPFISQLDGEVYWASMRGSADYHERLQNLYKGSPYEALVRRADVKGLTAIFEYCSSDNRIVVDYETTQMTLLALRHRVTGIYAKRSEVEDMGAADNVPVVTPYGVHDDNITDLIQTIHKAQGIEGAVIWFEDGRLAKLKGQWYQQLHKLLSYFDYEKDIARLILSNNQDDLLGILTPPKKASLITYQDALFAGIKGLIEQCETLRDNILAKNLSRKDFAMLDIENGAAIKFIIFKHYNNLEEAEFRSDIIAAALARTGAHGKWTDFKNNAGLNLTWDVQTN